jgi:hypothetical protein
MKSIGCGDCGSPLGNMEIALNLKLRGRAAGTLFCLQCLGQRLDCPREELTRMADFFRENGCELFSRRYVEEQGRDYA